MPGLGGPRAEINPGTICVRFRFVLLYFSDVIQENIVYIFKWFVFHLSIVFPLTVCEHCSRLSR